MLPSKSLIFLILVIFVFSSRHTTKCHHKLLQITSVLSYLKTFLKCHQLTAGKIFLENNKQMSNLVSFHTVILLLLLNGSNFQKVSQVQDKKRIKSQVRISIIWRENETFWMLIKGHQSQMSCFSDCLNVYNIEINICSFFIIKVLHIFNIGRKAKSKWKSSIILSHSKVTPQFIFNEHVF